MYRPPKNRDDELYGGSIEEIKKSKRFVPDKGFAGADESSGGRGSGPVQFEKDAEDIFGIDKLLTDAKRGSKRGADEKHEKSKRRKDYD